MLPVLLLCPKGWPSSGMEKRCCKKWGALSAQDLNPSRISYKPKNNSRTVQGKRNKAGVQVAMGSQDGGGDNYIEGATVQATVPDESQVDVSVHCF